MNKFFKIYANSFKGLSLESWMLSVVMLINRTGSMVLPFLGVYMVDHLKFSLEESGYVLACFGVGSIIGSSLGGYLTDKFGEFYVQSTSLFVSIPLFCLYPLFQNPMALGLMVLIQSIVSEIFRPANSVAIAKYAKPENLTRAFSLNRMAVNLGFSIGPALGGFMAAYSYNFLFYGNAFFTLGAGVMYLYFFNRRQKLFRIKQTRKNRDHTTVITHGEKIRSPYKDAPFLIFCIICAVFSICFFQLMNTLPLFYKDEVRLNQSTIGFLMGANGFVVVIFEMLLVHMAEKKLSAAKTLLYGTLMCSTSFLLLTVDHNLALLFFSISLLSLGEILALPFMATITAQRAAPTNKGAYMGVNGISFSLAFIVSPILGTKIAVLYGFTNLWMGTGVLMVACALAFFYYVPILLNNKASNIK
jgi:predicted MFS family arabinose efflux permease